MLCTLPTNTDALIIIGAFSPTIFTEGKKQNIVLGHCYATILSEGSSDTLYIATKKKVKMMKDLQNEPPQESLRWKKFEVETPT